MSKKPLKEVKTSKTEEVPNNLEDSFGFFERAEGNNFSINLDKLRERKVFIATPAYSGKVNDSYCTSVVRLANELQKLGIEFSYQTLRNESLISRARNILVAMFLTTDFDYLFFIDADITFLPDAVIRALAYDRGIVAGAYPKKTLPIQYALNFEVLEDNKLNVQNGLAEVKDASTGFYCIKREVIEKMIKEYPELKYTQDSGLPEDVAEHCYALFDTMIDPVDNRYLSEDYCFGRRYQKIGGKVWIDLNTKLDHAGEYVFEGDISKIVNRS